MVPDSAQIMRVQMDIFRFYEPVYFMICVNIVSIPQVSVNVMPDSLATTVLSTLKCHLTQPAYNTAMARAAKPLPYMVLDSSCQTNSPVNSLRLWYVMGFLGGN